MVCELVVRWHSWTWRCYLRGGLELSEASEQWWCLVTARINYRPSHGCSACVFADACLLACVTSLHITVRPRAWRHRPLLTFNRPLLTTLEPRARRRTLGADKAYDMPDFVAGVRACNTTPHAAQNIHEK